jgi:hypothetical protein
MRYASYCRSYEFVNLGIKPAAPPSTTIVLISGTHSTLNPFYVKVFLILSNDELLPPQGPPVTTILYTGYLGLLLNQYCLIGVLRYRSLIF